MKISILHGNKVKLQIIRLRFSIIRIALRMYKNPVTTLSILKKIIRRRQQIHGGSRIRKFVQSGSRYFWATDFPGFPSAAFNACMRNEIIRTKSEDRENTSLQTVIWGITNRCPLSCKHCFEWDNLSLSDRLSLSDLMLILEKIRGQDIHHIQLSGGEPLVRFNDMIEIIMAGGPGIDFWLLTSGFGLTSEKALALKSAGLIGVQISLDHWDEHLHNEFRANDLSFRWVREAVANCKKAGIIVSLSLCATKEFISNDNLWKYMDLAKEWGVHFVRLLEPRNTGRFANTNPELNAEEISILENFYTCYLPATVKTDHPILIYPGHHQRKVGCFGAGNRYLYIDSVGRFHACPFCLQEQGNALQTSFDEAIRKIRERKCHAFKEINAP